MQKQKQDTMTNRGATRPEMKHDKMEQDGGSMNMDRGKMLEEHHTKTQWIYWLVITLGAWLIMAPLTFSYFQNYADLPGGRTLALSPASRALVLFWSDIISGALLIVLGYISLKPNKPFPLWIACGIGVWLNAAPLIFWAPSPFIYLNETLVGTLIIALTVLIPGMPNMVNYMQMGAEMPPGWSYNPSSWGQRSILIILGFMGWIVSRYLGAFQLGYTEYIWDPFFGDSSRLVLTSHMSESLPISDASLGAFAYTFEFLMGWMGSQSRWRTMPWMVTLFGILVIPLGLVHIFLVISQPVIVGHWCTFCLLAALIMLPMIPLEVDEVIVMIQYMKKSKKNGASLWKIFWKGGGTESMDMDMRSPKISKFPYKPGAMIKSAFWGMSFSLYLVLTTLIGLWVIFVPGIFNASPATSDIFHLTGALIFTVSILAAGEPIRTIRFSNVLLGAGLIISLFFTGASAIMVINGIAAGVAAALLSIPKGRIAEKFGSWDKYIV